MRKALTIIVFLLVAIALPAQNTQQYAQLDSLLNVYVVALQAESPEDKMAETAFMIGSAKDSTTQSHIALWLFDYYAQSPLMGEEEIALHIYDTWIASGKVAPRSEFDAMQAKLFADFNRNSLIGMSAPSITLLKPCGGKQTIPAKGTSALIWFYDCSCSKCQLQAKLLPKILAENVSTPINFYAVYSGTDPKVWRKFRKSFRLQAKNVKLIHLWDPEINSDYLRLYGVISTPKLFMVESGGLIIGRRLELDNLPQIFMLDSIISQTITK